MAELTLPGVLAGLGGLLPAQPPPGATARVVWLVVIYRKLV